MSRSLRTRMHEHAIAVLEAAAEEAQAGPIDAQPAVRLALYWLLVSRVAEVWQARSFWEALTEPLPQVAGGEPHFLSVYCRTRDMALCLDRWRNVASGGGE